MGEKVYLFGGVTDTRTSTDKVLVASRNGNGTLGTFAEAAGTKLVTPRHFGWACRIGDFVYVVGGFTGMKESATTNTVERASIRPDDTLGAFETVPGVSLVAGRGGFGYVNTGSFLYVAGGKGTGTLASTERAPV